MVTVLAAHLQKAMLKTARFEGTVKFPRDILGQYGAVGG